MTERLPLPGRTAADRSAVPASSLLPFVLTLALTAGVARTQQVVLGSEDYIAPPDEIAEILTSDAMHNQTSLNGLGPDGRTFLEGISGGMVPLERLSRPFLNLGETPIDVRANRSRRLTTGYTVGYHLIDARSGARRPVEVPAGTTVGSAAWSPDGRAIAFLVHEDEGSYIHTADLETGQSSRLCDLPVNASLVTSLQWSGNSDAVVAVLVPEDRGPRPEPGLVPSEPTVWIGREGKVPSRTYRFLLKSPYDKAMLEYLTTGQLAVIGLDGSIDRVGEPRMFTSVDPSPTLDAFRVRIMERPFSYFVPRSRFGSRTELWSRNGELIEELGKRPLRDGSRNGNGDGDDDDDKDEERVERRNLSWLPDGSGMTFLQREPEPEKDEAKDGDAAAGDGDAKTKADADKKPDAKKADGKKADGKKAPDADKKGRKKAQKPDAKKPDPKTKVADADAAQDADTEKEAEKKDEKKKRKDRVVHWMPPYSEDSTKVVFESEDPIQSVQYTADAGRIFVTQTVKGVRKVYAVDLADPSKTMKILEKKPENGSSRRSSWRGGGGLETKDGPMGVRVVRTSTDGKYVYMTGSDDPEDPETQGPRAYLERLEIGTGESEKIWRSAADVYETMTATLDDDYSEVVLSRQSATTIPDNWLLDRESGEMKQLTENVDPAPEVTAAKRVRFKVKRVDGFEFWVEATIPRDHGEKLPALFWFYPREYANQKEYDESQSRNNPNRFPMMRTRSMELMTMLGYVVVRPDCPIVGEDGEYNDNYVPDLRNSLWAVIDELDERRIIDRDRLAIGGHSYGAFGTANAMIHTPFFKAGIAGAGNYNRTLTPMSFQRERRYLWGARETYTRMSPLFWANQLNGALLMYHGKMDNNTGTFPINSPRMFQALDGLGKPVALYMYPYEGHGQIAHETLFDLWARWTGWLDIHVKHPERSKEMYQQPEPKPAAPDVILDPSSPPAGSGEPGRR